MNLMHLTTLLALSPVVIDNSSHPLSPDPGLDHQPLLRAAGDSAHGTHSPGKGASTGWPGRADSPSALSAVLHAYAAEVGGSRRLCHTPLLVELYRNREALGKQTRLALEAAAAGEALPPSEGYVESDRLPLRVHYASNTYLATAENVLALAEHAWDVEVPLLGFSEPLPDNGVGGDDALDIYLASYDLTAGGAYTQPTYWDADPSDAVQSCSSYIVLYEDLDETVLPVYVAHEFNHACQCAMDFRELTWAWETTATFMEDIVYDDINDYYGYIPYFQAYPEQTLVYFDTMPPYALYPYGASIFIHFLNETIGSSNGLIAARLWRRTGQPGIDNEPDFLDAVDDLATGAGWHGLDETYATFSLWRYLVGPNDDGHHFEEGAAWSDTESGGDAVPPVRREISSTDLPVDASFGEVCTLGTSYLLIDVDEKHQDRVVALSADTQADTRLGLAATRLYASARSEDVLLSPDPTSNIVQADLELDSADRVLVAWLNLGSASYDPDSPEDDTASCVDIHYTVDLEAEGGCGSCSNTPGLAELPPGLFVSVVLTLRAFSRRKRRRSVDCLDDSTCISNGCLLQ